MVCEIILGNEINESCMSCEQGSDITDCITDKSVFRISFLALRINSFLSENTILNKYS
jgi:hypothetical protein